MLHGKPLDESEEEPRHSVCLQNTLHVQDAVAYEEGVYNQADIFLFGGDRPQRREPDLSHTCTPLLRMSNMAGVSAATGSGIYIGLRIVFELGKTGILPLISIIYNNKVQQPQGFKKMIVEPDHGPLSTSRIATHQHAQVTG